MTNKDTQTAKLDPSGFFKNLSSQDFLNFGLHDVAYIRSIDVQGDARFAIHAADGTLLSVLDSMDSALGVISHNDLEVMRLQ